jgi:periplasmic divalent cation tolerance protein
MPGPATQVSENQCIVVLCTCPEGAPATQLAEQLVVENLAACVNRVAGVVSHYRWQGRVHQDTETLLLIKTTQDRLAALSARIMVLHPYELPEVVAVPVVGGLEAYLDWIRASVSGPSS